MIGKYRRYDMIGAINYYCRKNDGLHITYIEKKTKSELEAIIAQYDINVDEMLFESAQERETVDNFTENLKQKFTETVQKGLEVFKCKIEMLESLLNDEQKEEYNKFLVTLDSN
jgi:hypothetical protein